MRSRFVLTALALLTAVSTARADFIWWEAETPASTNFPAKSPLSQANFQNRADQLSGGKWLSASGKRGADPLFAQYNITVPTAGRYSLWVRKFWLHGPFRWRFDDQPWGTCGRDIALLDPTPLAKFIEADWVSLGKVQLPAGKHTFRIELLAGPGEETACGFDCFVLTPGPFVPDGKLKPGQRTGRADPGYFAFEPGIDNFTESPVDLRYLNESAAGIHGPVRRAGDHIALGDGKPVRFWAVDVGMNNAAQDHDTVDYMARKLAKLGVNLVRFHDPLYDPADPTKIDPKALDRVHYLVAALAKQGIYTDLSLYYPLWIDASKLGRPGYESLQNKHPFATLYFDPAVQQQWKRWVTDILSPVNPYSGKSLAADPAVAVVEVVNEDSLLFWSFDHKNIPTAAWADLEADFTKWIAGRYGSVEKARSTWGGVGLPGDLPTHLTLTESWGITAAGAAATGKLRAGDQLHFLAEKQRAWYAAAGKIFRGLGYRGLVNSTNWFVADPPTEEVFERWTYAAVDMTDQHGYFDPPDIGPRAGYSVGVGDVFKPRASVLEPTAVPIRSIRTAGHPTTISELGWTNPNPYRADATFLSAAYGSLQGTDGMDFFELGSDFLLDHSVTKFAVSGPVVSGSFPAAALVYRRGDIQVGKPVFDQMVELDKFHESHAWPSLGHGIDDLAPFVGPVVRRFDGTPAETVDAGGYIDRAHKSVTSDTGQLHWDWGVGVATVNTPAAVGAAGFLGKYGPIFLGDVTIQCRNEFAAVWVVSLDGRPLKTSKKILVQVTTREQPVGFKTKPVKDGLEITDLGSSPMGAEKIDATVTLKSPATMRALDENGYPKGPAGAPATEFRLSADSIASILER
jgi:hypothetical protein